MAARLTLSRKDAVELINALNYARGDDLAAYPALIARQPGHFGWLFLMD